MRKALSVCIFFLLIISLSAYGQDTLNFKGRHYQFLPGATDTAHTNGGNYIVKYIVEPEMGDFMRENGKIYVVIMVLATIFAGIFAYLVFLDRKIGRMEKQNKP